MSKSKITKSHSTAIPAARMIYEKISSLNDVSKISYGIINKCKPIRGNRRVKILAESGCFLLKVRDIASVQELRVYTTELFFEKILVKELTELNFDVTIGKS